MNAAPSIAERTAAITRAAARLCAHLGWAPLQEVPLPSGRRLDLMALQPSGDLVAIEVKSCTRDFLSDGKWPEYRAWCDGLHFAVDGDFPRSLLPDDVGLIVADGHEAVLLRAAPPHRMAAARRRALLHRYARLAAGRLAALRDPDGGRALRAALAVE